MKSLKNKIVAAFESDTDVARAFRNHKFIVGRIPLPQFAEKGSKESVFQISCDPQYDLRTQSALAERALHALGYKSDEIRKNIMVSGMAARFILAVSTLGLVVYNIDKGLLIVDLQRTQLPAKWSL